MAVEARQNLNLFLTTTRGTTMNRAQGIGNVYRMVDPVVPMIGSAMAGNVTHDSGLTIALPVSRKRSRDALSLPNSVRGPIANNRCSSFSFLGEDFSLQFLRQQQEIDRFITQHMENLRMAAEERRKSYSRIIAAAAEENIMKKLKAKDEEINKMENINLALEERVKSLSMENEIWRELAQTNEATANALRCNLEQVLARVQDEGGAEDAQSCCGGSLDLDLDSGSVGVGNRMCRKCGKQESCVLLLPCRHLCLCTVCGSSLHTCPVCNSTKTASVHVNRSPSS